MLKNIGIALLMLTVSCGSGFSPKPVFHGIPGVIEVTFPERNAVICRDGQVTIKGKARGWWFFEASAPVTIQDVHGQPINLGGYVMTTENWMTDEFVPFEGKINFREPQGMTGTITMHKDNPSGLPEHDRSYTFPVRFGDCK